MSKFDFDKMTNRLGSGSVRWDDEGGVELPLWVADMDFEACPDIVEALRRRVEHGIFGYAMPKDDYYDAVSDWHWRRHGVRYEKEWMIVVPGIVPAISAILRATTQPGEGVLLLSPDYNCFYSSIRNMGCRAEESILKLRDGRFEIDFDDLEQRAAKDDVKVMLLCSPHNPTGRLWSRDELSRIAEIALRHSLTVVEDQIHCELTKPGTQFIPLAALDSPIMERTAICTSASKTFNIAGLQNAQIVVPNPELRSRIDRAVNIHEVCDVNPLGIEATKAAYLHGETWLKELREYIWANYEAAKEYLTERHPQMFIAPLEATYLMWADISWLTKDDEDFVSRLQQAQQVRLAPGCHYGSSGEGHLRINLATQRSRLMEAIRRLSQFIDTQDVKR